MLRFVIYCGVIILLSAAAGCSTLQRKGQPSQESAANFATLDSADAAILLKRTEAFTRAMVRSFKSGDFTHWQEQLKKEGDPKKPLIVSEAKFRAMHERLKKHWGTLVDCHYFGSLDQSVFREYIWRCTFESKTDSGETIRLEELFVVRCTLLNGKTTFTGFGFRFFNSPGFRDQVMKIKKAEVKNEKIN